MAKKASTNTSAGLETNLHFPGLSNLDKLKHNAKHTKANAIHRFDPFNGNYHSKIKDNIEAESIDPRYLPEEVYAQMLMQNLNHQHMRRGRNKNVSMFDLEAKRRRQKLIELSSHDMLDEVLTKVADELVVTGTDAQHPVNIDINENLLRNAGVKDDVIEKLTTLATDTFHTIYNAYGFRDKGSNKSFYNKVYQFLVEGCLAYTYVFDNIDKPKKLIGAVEVDALDLQHFYKDGIKYWVNNRTIDKTKDDKILLYDSQICRIMWSDLQNNNRFSYLEHLIRPFNNARIMDEAKVIWHVNNAQYRLMFEIPTKGLSRIKAATVLATEQQRFYDDINYDNSTGELNVNGQPNLKMSKEYWMGSGDSGTPSITSVGGDGPELNDPGMNEYFNRKFYRNSRMPYSRFDSTASEAWNTDVQSQLREEISTGRFIGRIREMLSYLFIKPILIQLAIDIPEIKDDPQILDAIGVRFESYSIFSELMNMELLKEKLEYIEQMREALAQEDIDGNQIPFFSQKFLIEKYLPEITEEDVKLNQTYREKEQDSMFKYMKRKAELSKELEELTDE